MGIVLGFIAGLVGAAVWGAITYYTGYEIGYLAWGIGAAVGIAVAAGAGKSNPALGLAAVLITVVSICGGKYAALEAALQKELSIATEEIEAGISENLADEEFLVSYLADEVIEQQAADGKLIDWPDGVDPTNATAKDDYPASIWKQAQGKWDGMDAAAKDSHKEQASSSMHQNIDIMMASVMNEARNEGFIGSFGPMDLLFFGLAVFTSWKIAGSKDEGAEVM